MSKNSNTLTRRQLAKLAGTGLAAGIAGCSSGEDGNDGNDGSDGSSVDELTLLTWNISFLEESINGWIEDFQDPSAPVEEDYSDTEISWVDRAAEDVPTYYQSQLQSGEPVEVVDTQSSTYTRFASEGVFASLDDFASDEFLSTLGEQAVEFSRMDGDLYRIPFYQNCSSTYIRNQWFEEAGIDEPPVSTTEFFDVAEEVVENSGANYGLTLVTFDYRIWPFFWAEDIPVLNDSQDEAAFNTSRAVEIVERFQQLTDDGVIPEVTWTGRVEEQSNQFGSGDTAMFITPLASVRRVQSAGDWVNEDSFGLSVPPGNRGTYQAHGLSITSHETSDAAQQAAWDLIRVVLSDKWQEDFLRNSTVMAGNTEVQSSLAEDEEFRQNNPLKAKAYDLWPELTEGYVMPPLISASSEIANILDTQISTAALGEKEPQAALDDAEQRVNDLLSN